MHIRVCPFIKKNGGLKVAENMGNSLKAEYMHQRRRVQNLIYSLNKNGNIAQASDIIGGVPKEVTQSDIDNLKNFKTQTSIKDAINVPENSTENYIPSENEIGMATFMGVYEGVPDQVEAVISEFTDAVIDTYGVDHLVEIIDYARDIEGLEPPVPYGSDWEKFLAEMSEYFIKLMNVLSTGNDDKDSEMRANIENVLDTYMGDWRSWDK